MNKKQNIDYAKNIDYIDYYIKELESRHGDIDKINELKRLKKIYLEQSHNDKNNSFKDSLKTKVENKKKDNKQGKKKIKRPSLKKQIAIGVLAGTMLGVPSAAISYNYVINLPSAHNYTTVREKRNNIEHDDSNYRKYLRNMGLTEEQIEERIQEEEKNNRWNRQDER